MQEHDQRVSPHSLRYPGSAKRSAWSLLVCTALTYNLVMVPFRVAFGGDIDPASFHGYAADFVGDLLFLIDVHLHLHHFGYLHAGIVYTDYDDCRQHYKRSRRWAMDFLAALPLELLPLLMFAFQASPATCSTHSKRAGSALRWRPRPSSACMCDTATRAGPRKSTARLAAARRSARIWRTRAGWRRPTAPLPSTWRPIARRY